VFQTKLTYDTAAHFSYDSTKVEFSGGTVRLLDLGGATYSTTNPTVSTQQRFGFSAISAFAHTASTPAGTAIKYQLKINGTLYWRNTSTSLWEESDGTYSESNTQTELNAALGSLVTDLALEGNNWCQLVVFLHSDSGAARPVLTDATFTHAHVESAGTSIAECLVYCYLSDLLGDAYDLDASFPIRLHVKNHRAFFHGNKLIQPFHEQATFDANGYAELSVIETESVGENVEFAISYYEGPSLKWVRLTRNVVPNVATRALSQIAVTDSDDAG
jgi:hypothetical protein